MSDTPAWYGDPGDTRAWVRVASTLLDRIGRGEYTVRLPGRAALVGEFGVAARTVQRAISELAELDVVYRVPGLGYHVRPSPADGPDGPDGPVGGAAGGAVGGAVGGVVGGVVGDRRAWVRLADDLLDRIAHGELKPCELVPSRKTLCQEYGCSRSPVTHALTTLERRGVLRRIPGVGYQVMPPLDGAGAQGMGSVSLHADLCRGGQWPHRGTAGAAAGRGGPRGGGYDQVAG
jgi:DNA-binding GntR family transcriptional regulator